MQLYEYFKPGLTQIVLATGKVTWPRLHEPAPLRSSAFTCLPLPSLFPSLHICAFLPPVLVTIPLLLLLHASLRMLLFVFRDLSVSFVYLCLAFDSSGPPFLHSFVSSCIYPSSPVFITISNAAQTPLHSYFFRISFSLIYLRFSFDSILYRFF